MEGGCFHWDDEIKDKKNSFETYRSHGENACFYVNKFLTRMVKSFKLGTSVFPGKLGTVLFLITDKLFPASDGVASPFWLIWGREVDKKLRISQPRTGPIYHELLPQDGQAFCSGSFPEKNKVEEK